MCVVLVTQEYNCITWMTSIQLYMTTLRSGPSAWTISSSSTHDYRRQLARHCESKHIAPTSQSMLRHTSVGTTFKSRCWRRSRANPGVVGHAAYAAGDCEQAAPLRWPTRWHIARRNVGQLAICLEPQLRRPLPDARSAGWRLVHVALLECALVCRCILDGRVVPAARTTRSFS